MKPQKLFFVFFLTLLLAGCLFAQPTIKLNVPLQLSDLHQGVSSVNVTGIACEDAAGHIPVADGIVEIACPADGNINQTVVVVLTQRPDTDITKAIRCRAELRLKVNGTWQMPVQSSNTPVEYQAKEGTTFAWKVSEDVNWQK